MPPAKTKISSFSTPTPGDCAAWNALSASEQRELVEEEIERSFQSTPIRVDDLGAFSKDIFEEALSEITQK